jgi:tryptophan-rich sensory protein
MFVRLLIFLLLNFGALGIGGLFSGAGAQSDWYMGLNKAPWTPPGWVFGAAWTTIMLCFSVYMAYLWTDSENRKLVIGLYACQWALNVTWNPSFFYLHKVTLGFGIILMLTLLIGYMLFIFWPVLKEKSLLLLPYFVWLLIATSLNGYIFFRN